MVTELPGDVGESAARLTGNPLCVQLVHHGWVLWHHLGPGWWWSRGLIRDLPAGHFPLCSKWVYNSPTLDFTNKTYV